MKPRLESRRPRLNAVLSASNQLLVLDVGVNCTVPPDFVSFDPESRLGPLRPGIVVVASPPMPLAPRLHRAEQTVRGRR